MSLKQEAFWSEAYTSVLVFLLRFRKRSSASREGLSLCFSTVATRGDGYDDGHMRRRQPKRLRGLAPKNWRTMCSLRSKCRQMTSLLRPFPRKCISALPNSLTLYLCGLDPPTTNTVDVCSSQFTFSTMVIMNRGPPFVSGHRLSPTDFPLFHLFALPLTNLKG